MSEKIFVDETSFTKYDTYVKRALNNKADKSDLSNYATKDELGLLRGEVTDLDQVLKETNESVTSLDSKVNSKADASDLVSEAKRIDVLSSTVSNKANLSDLSELRNDMSDLEESVASDISSLRDNKADKSEVNAKFDAVYETIENLEYENGDLSNYATKDELGLLRGEVTDLDQALKETNESVTSLDSKVNSKADASDLVSEARRLDELSNIVAGKADQSTLAELRNDMSDLEEAITSDLVGLGTRVTNLENASGSSGSSQFRLLDRLNIGASYDTKYVDLGSYISSYDELMIIVRTVTSSATSIGISNSTAASNTFLTSTSVSSTTYTKILINKTDEGYCAYTVGTSFGWGAATSYPYLKYYNSAGSSVNITVVIHGR